MQLFAGNWGVLQSSKAVCVAQPETALWCVNWSKVYEWLWACTLLPPWPPLCTLNLTNWIRIWLVAFLLLHPMAQQRWHGFNGWCKIGMLTLQLACLEHCLFHHCIEALGQYFIIVWRLGSKERLFLSLERFPDACLGKGISVRETPHDWAPETMALWMNYLRKGTCDVNIPNLLGDEFWWQSRGGRNVVDMEKETAWNCDVADQIFNPIKFVFRRPETVLFWLACASTGRWLCGGWACQWEPELVPCPGRHGVQESQAPSPWGADGQRIPWCTGARLETWWRLLRPGMWRHLGCAHRATGVLVSWTHSMHADGHPAVQGFCEILPTLLMLRSTHNFVEDGEWSEEVPPPSGI